MNIRTGVDFIEVERIQEVLERHGARFLERVFTQRERAEANGRTASLAVRFAAKEAVSKALGSGIGLVTWQDIEIRSRPGGQPELHLSGEAARLAADLGLETWSVSLSHSREIAVAFVVGVGSPSNQFDGGKAEASQESPPK